MWAQLGLAGLKSIQDEHNRKQDIASNVINQKYAPWTGQQADFSSIAKNKTLEHMMAGYGAGSLQDAMNAGQAQPTAQPAVTTTTAPTRAPAATVAPQAGGGSSFASVASRAPAVDAGGNMAPSGQVDFQSMFNKQYQDPTPLMLQGRNPQGQGMTPWEFMAKGMVK